jgi:transposase-like protein
MENQIGELRRRPRRRYSAEEKERIIGLYGESGLSRSEFCRREGIDLINLQRWIGKKRRGEFAAGEKRGARFVEVESGRHCYGRPASLSGGIWSRRVAGVGERL